jgi:hypothetical protein
MRRALTAVDKAGNVFGDALIGVVGLSGKKANAIVIVAGEPARDEMVSEPGSPADDVPARKLLTHRDGRRLDCCRFGGKEPRFTNSHFRQQAECAIAFEDGREDPISVCGCGRGRSFAQRLFAPSHLVDLPKLIVIMK